MRNSNHALIAQFWRGLAVGLRFSSAENRRRHFEGVPGRSKGMRGNTLEALGPAWVKIMESACHAHPPGTAARLTGISLFAAATSLGRQFGKVQPPVTGRGAQPFMATGVIVPGYRTSAGRLPSNMTEVRRAPTSSEQADWLDDDWLDDDDELGPSKGKVSPAREPAHVEPAPPGQTSLREAAYHEAGHAVAVYALLGLDKIDRVRVSGLGGGVCDYRSRGGAPSHQVIIALAGPRAQERALGKATGHAGDLEYVSEKQAGMGAAERAFNREETTKLVDENWPAIEAVANALIQRRSLTGPELGRVIADARFQAAYRGEGW